MGRFAIVAYTPKPGKDEQLLELVRKHLQVLKTEQFVTERATCVMRAASGAIVEVFEWCSREAIEKAHSNPAVLELWEAFGAACDYTPLASLAERRTCSLNLIQFSFEHFLFVRDNPV